jgi:hypothetical protein
MQGTVDIFKMDVLFARDEGNVFQIDAARGLNLLGGSFLF